MGSAIEAALVALGLQDELDVPTMGDYLMSVIAEGQDQQQMLLKQTLQSFLNVSDEKLVYASKAIFQAYQDNASISRILPIIEQIIPSQSVLPTSSTFSSFSSSSSTSSSSASSSSQLLHTISKPVSSAPRNATSKTQKTTTKGTPIDASLLFWSGYNPPTETDIPSSSSSSSSSMTDVRVCRHFLAGSCLRKDCTFRHDVENVPCSFFSAPGGCASGNACPFKHDESLLVPDQIVAEERPDHKHNISNNNNNNDNDDDDPAFYYSAFDGVEEDDWLAMLSYAQHEVEERGKEQKSSVSSSPPIFAVDLRNEQLFPALGGGASSASSILLERSSPTITSASPSLISTTTFGAKLILQMLAEAFPGVSYHQLESYYIQGGGALSQISHIITQDLGVEPVPGSLQAKRIAASTTTTTNTSTSSSLGVHYTSSSSSLSSSVSHLLLQTAKAIATGISRVSTGAAVASLYADFRKDAIALAHARNAAFDKATRAFLAGQKADATNWSAQGRTLDMKMKQAQQEASLSIFKARNYNNDRSFVEVDDAVSGIRIKVNIYDLHGLHPSEAVSFAEMAILQNRNSSGSGNQKWIAFLTGTRHHSQKLGKGGGSLEDALVAQITRESSSSSSSIGYTHVFLPVGGVVVVNCV